MTQHVATMMILRFRDLVTSPGDTVANHNAIAGAGRYVWWGWWNKSGETIPDTTFRRLNGFATAPSGLRVLLLDSGRDLIFAAVCREIRWDVNHQRIASPDPAQTPPYYSTQHYQAWFKLEVLEQVDAAELQKQTYVRVDEFFANGESRYAPFYGKRVHDAHELRQQDRTIWFVRPFTEGDGVHELKLLNAKQFEPSTYEPHFAQSKSFNLLWISDLHCSEQHYAFPAAPTSSKCDLGQAIEEAAGKHGVQDFAGVLVSGDITWKADAKEFEIARNALGRIASSPSKLDNYRFAVVPGNHDLGFSPEPSDKTGAVNEAVAPNEARANFARFYQELFYLSPNQYLSSGRRFLLGGAVPVEVACLNSSLIEQKKGWYQGHGFIGDGQLRDVELGMGWTLPPPATRPFRVVMLHHHLMPVTYRETPQGGVSHGVVFDAEAVVQWLIAHRVDLVLHGHMHTDFCARVSRPIKDPASGDSSWHTFHVLGMGSSGVTKEHRLGPNTFGILHFTEEAVRVSVLSIDAQGPSALVSQVNLPRRSNS